ncbi:nuclear pore complex subunit [Kickxella alabastrina]|uniref:Nuclear pore complex subunit n=1 Tax=Kickxella alabastrina TaxID=61397 RepID=A0ACC1IU94_9FUNG|nr:nuclear pore complex subunit [Kickxella alabastrina]
MTNSLSLSSLLEESKRLTTHLTSTEIPTVQRGIDLLEAESRKLVARSVRNSTAASGRTLLDPRAQSLLASSGVDTDELTENVASTAMLSAFEMLQPSYDANVESFLAQQQEQSIVNAIEESELSTLDDFDRNMTAHMQQVWEDTQRRLFEELGQYQGTEPSPFAASIGLAGGSHADGVTAFDLVDTRADGPKVAHPRVERYAQVVRKLNDARVSAAARSSSAVQFDLLSGFEKATTDSSQELKSKQISQVWSLLSRYASTGGSNIVGGACDYLEHTFIEHVDRVIAQYPHEANVGGVPSVHRKIQGYLKVLFGRLGRVPTFLEVFNGEAIWAHMFMLYRCGYRQEMLKYALEMEDIITDSDPCFVIHLKAFIDRTPGLHQADFAVTAASLEDPYKAALYKVLGRGNVPRKASSEVVQTTEDYLWSSLVQIREADAIAAATSSVHPRSTLEDLQKLMLKFGPVYFDPHGNNPLLYLRVLLLCGLFEHAVDYLLQVDRFQIEAVHMAIALVFYRLLRVPSVDSAEMTTTAVSMSSYLVADAGAATAADDHPSLDFSRMVIHYARALPDSAADDAINYLLLLTLPTDNSRNSNSSNAVRQRAQCEQAIVRILYEKQDYAHFLGDIQSDGTRQRGFLERYLPLMGITTSEQFSQAIIRRLADRSRDEGRLADTVLLYNLGERYNTVLNVLCKQLGEVLYVHANSGASAASLASTGESMGLEDVDGVARAVLAHYKQREHIARALDDRAVTTCTTLLAVIDFLTCHQRGAYEDALQIIESTQLLPLGSTADSAAASLTAGQYAERVRSLDDSITRNFSLILLVAMDTLSRLYAGLKESPFLDAVKQANMQILRKKARCLMVFAGMIQFRMPSDTYAKLNRMDVFMN